MNAFSYRYGVRLWTGKGQTCFTNDDYYPPTNPVAWTHACTPYSWC